jgi:hypothetical protein
MGFLDPCVGDRQEYVTAANVEDTMHHTPGMIAGDRDVHLLPDAPIAMIERWGLSDARLIEPQGDGS